MVQSTATPIEVTGPLTLVITGWRPGPALSAPGGGPMKAMPVWWGIVIASPAAILDHKFWTETVRAAGQGTPSSERKNTLWWPYGAGKLHSYANNVTNRPGS